MRFLILCIFFDITKSIVKCDAQLVQIVEDLKSQVDGLRKNQNHLKSQVDYLKKNQNRDGRINNLKNELDYLKTNMSNQESRIQANEDSIEINLGNIELNANSLGVSIFYLM